MATHVSATPNLGPHGLYPEADFDRWLVVGTVPYNAALWSARGRWIALNADDDALAPDAVEKLCVFVRENRLELGYGRIRQVAPDGSIELLNRYPPERGQAGLLGGIYHAGLRFFDLDVTAYLFDNPNDYSQLLRMIRAGVRIGFLDDTVADYYPSTLWERGRAVPEE